MGASIKSVSEEQIAELNELEDAAVELRDKLDLKGAHGVLRRHLELARSVYGDGDEQTIESMMAVCESYCELGESKASIDMARNALELSEKYLVDGHEVIGTANQCLGNMLSFAGMYEEAEAYLRKALATYSEKFGLNGVETGRVTHDLGLMLMRSGDHERAEPLLRRAVSIFEGSEDTGSCSPASALHTLGHLMFIKGNLDSAGSLLRRALQLKEETLGQDDPDTALTLSMLADVSADKDDGADPEPLFLRAIAIEERVLGPDHPQLAGTLFKYARYLEDRESVENNRKAIPLFRRTIGIFENFDGNADVTLAAACRRLARLLIDDGAYAEAEQFLVRAQNIRRTMVDRDLEVDEIINKLLQSAQGKRSAASTS